MALRRAETILTIVAIVMLLLGPVEPPPAEAGPGYPIEGTWEFEGGSVYVYQVGPDHLKGKVVKPTKFGDCTHPKGQVMWDIYGSGTSYSGNHIGFYLSDCSENPGFTSTWEVVGAEQDMLRFCWVTPEGSSGCHELSRQVDRYPIIFLHGLLGSEISCGNDRLWPDVPPEFLEMRLADNGVDNLGSSKCNEEAGINGNIVKSFAGAKVYGPAVEFLEGLPRKTYLFVYDWRKSPGRAIGRLNELVNRARSATGYKKVVLVAHSMGGLVARWYVQDAARAEKVARILTIGSPHWGAPSPWLALSQGWSSALDNSLDKIIPDRELKRFARNATGPYYLYPSRFYAEETGGWLWLPAYGDQPVPTSEIPDAVELYLGNPALISQALADHDAFLDWYPETDVQMHYVVGTGVRTVVGIKERTGGREPKYVWGNGDGTVPVLSASAGLSETYDVGLVTYICGVEHVPLPGDPTVTSLIKPYLLKGTPLPFGNWCDPPS